MDEYDAYTYDQASAGHADYIAKLKKRANNHNDYTIVHTKGGDQNSERVEFIHEDAYTLDADALYGAAIAGDTDAISQFEMRHDMLNSREETILHIESRNGNTERVRFILRQFAHKNILAKLDKRKRTALHWAASFGWIEVAEILIDAARHNLPPPPPPSDNDNYPHDDNPAVTSFQAFLRQADEDLNTALHAAVMGGHASTVKLLVEADPSDTHIQNRIYCKTPMYIAVEKGFNDIVEIISTTCTAPSLDGPRGSTALHIKNLDQAKSPGGTLYKIMDEDALYAAAIAGDADVIAIMEKRADKLYANEETILHLESEKGYTERVQFILREFGHKNILAKLDKRKRTALYWAAYFGRTEVAKILIDTARHNLPPPPSDNNNNNTDHDNPAVTSFQAFLRQADVYLNTALHAAVMGGHASIVKLLVEADPSDTHIQNRDDRTPMYIAVEEGFNDVVEIISTTCTAPSLDGPRGSTALHAAIMYHHDIEVVNLLIGAARHLPPSSDNDNPAVTPFQAFLRRGDEEMDTALHIAVMQDKMDIVKLLVEADPSDTHIQNDEGKTPMYIAVERGLNDVVEIISTICTAPSLDGPGGSTALHAASKHADIEVVNLLIGVARRLHPCSDNDNPAVTSPFQAFLRRGDKEMNSALHIAVMQGNMDIVKLLVEADPSDTHIGNNQGKTPIYIAVENRRIDIVKVICTTCTASPNLDGPAGTALHAAIKNLNQAARKEDRDVIRLIIDTVKRANDEFRLVELFKRTDEKKCIILELAVEGNHLDVVKLILAENPSYHQLLYTSYLRSFYFSDFAAFLGIMPLIYKANDKNYNAMVILLTETYQRVMIKFMDEDLQYMPELISAIGSRNKESVFNLLSDGHYNGYIVEHLVTFVDNLGWTALHHAAYHEFDSIIPEIVEAQKKFRHDSFVYQDMVSTPFHVAAQKGNTSTVKLLLELWPSSTSPAYIAVDKNGQNILHLAALQSKKEMILDILKKCPEEYKKEFVNKQDNNGNTPLHLLIERGCFVAELFKYGGLDIWVPNNKNWTPPDMLYFDEDQTVNDDQVHIKFALDGMRNIDPTRDIFSSSVVPSKRERKDDLLNNKAERMVHEEYARIKLDDTHHAIANCFAHAIAGDPISKGALKMKAAADTLDESGETILHVESKKGDIENVRFIVGGAFANKSLLGKLDGLKQTALHLAADHGHTQVVEVLIEAAARHDFPSSNSSANDHDAHNTVGSFQDFLRQANFPNRNTALHLAVLDGNLKIVKLLVEADPNDRHVPNNEGKTPIYIAAEKGYKDIVKEICTTCTALSLDGPPCRTSTTARTTALHALIQNIGQVTEGANDVIRMMVDAAKRWSSADFEALFTRVDESGSTVLQLAVDRNDADAVKLIIKEDPAYQHGGEIKRHGLMLLIFKAINDQRSDDIIKSLSEAYEAGIINPDHKDVLALILAIQRLDEDYVLSHLRDDAKHLVTFTEDNGWTPLHYAVYLEFDSILDVIIKAQKEVEHPFEYGNMESTPFYIAVKHGYTSTLVRLLELWPASPSVDIAKSPYTIVDKDGRNILHLATAADNRKEYTIVNKDGQNILQLAAAADNRKEMVHGILKYCPEKYKDEMLKQKDKINGDTPLHLLISLGCFIPKLIKHKGLDTMARNNKDYTPRDMLYVEDGIIADQVHIKIAIDEFQTNQSAVWKLWPKRTKKKTDIWKCNKVPPSKRKIKDGKFEAGKKKLMDDNHKQMKDDLERYKTRTNTQIVVTALITTVTFTVGFTMPGGLHQSGEVDEGLVVFSRKRAFNVFMVSDALALLMSTLSLFFYFLESMNEDPHQVQILNASSTVLNILSVMGMMLTFIAGTYVVLSDSRLLAIGVCIIGSLFFLIIIILWIIKIVYGRYVKNNKD